MPHFKSFPYPELSKKIKRFDPIKTVSFFQPIMQQNKLSRIVIIIKTYPFFADGIVLSQPFLFFLF